MDSPRPNGTSLPACLTESYTTYKNGTQDVLQWLNKANRNVQCQLSSSSPLRDVLKVTKSVVWNFSTRKANVPEDILSKLRNVINLRQRCAGWYTKHGREGAKFSSEKHQYFISVMQRILHLLEKVASGNPLLKISDRTIDEYIDRTELDSDADFKVAVKDELGEDMIIIFCLLQDFRNIHA